MKNKVGMMILAVLVLALAVPMEAHAATRYGPVFFKTEDGKYELTIKTTSTNRTVDLDISYIYKVNKSTGKRTYVTDYSPLSVRLCSSTGKCTSYKKFINMGGFGHADFTNMLPATYHVDIRDNVSGYYFEGDVEAYVTK